jgi:phage recombination protein Bet
MSDDSLVEYGMNAAIVVTEDQLELIKSTVAVGATNDELKLFIHDCKRRGVHPLDKMIFFVKRGTGKDAKATHQCSIDYFRSEAEASGEYDGQDEPEFEYDDGSKIPSLARVRIYRKGIVRPFIGVARWSEFCPTGSQDFMWKKMPHGQIAKCAEAQGFRKAFPKKFQKLYVDDEMHQADYVNVTPSKSSTVRPQSAEPAPLSKEEEKKAGDLQEQASKLRKDSGEPEDTKEQFKTLIRKYCKGDKEKMQALQDELTMYNDKPVPNVDTANVVRINIALGKLKERIAEEYPKGCSLDPTTCDLVAYEGDMPYCSTTSEECPFTADF